MELFQIYVGANETKMWSNILAEIELRVKRSFQSPSKIYYPAGFLKSLNTRLCVTITIDRVNPKRITD